MVKPNNCQSGRRPHQNELMECASHIYLPKSCVGRPLYPSLPQGGPRIQRFIKLRRYTFVITEHGFVPTLDHPFHGDRRYHDGALGPSLPSLFYSTHRLDRWERRIRFFLFRSAFFQSSQMQYLSLLQSQPSISLSLA